MADMYSEAFRLADGLEVDRLFSIGEVKRSI